MKKERRLVGNEWLNFDKMLSVLAPDLYQEHLREMQSDSDEPGVYDRLNIMKGFAVTMVRYASSSNPKDYEAKDLMNKEKLLNPRTGQPFTFSDLNTVSRSDCEGVTEGIYGREKQVAKITVELYRKVYQFKL